VGIYPTLFLNADKMGAYSLYNVSMEKIIHVSKCTDFIEITTINGKKIIIKNNSDIEKIVEQIKEYNYEVLVISEEKNSNEYSFVLIYPYSENQYIFKYNNNYYFVIFYKSIPSTVEIEIENIYFNNDDITIPIYIKLIDKTIEKITISKKYLINWDGNKLSIIDLEN